MSDIDSLEKRLIENINKCVNLETLEQIRLAVLGKKGELTLLLKEIGSLDPEKRKERAFKLNLLKNNFLEKFNQEKSSLALILHGLRKMMEYMIPYWSISWKMAANLVQK